MGKKIYVLLFVSLIGSLASSSFQNYTILSFLQYVILICGICLVILSLKKKSSSSEKFLIFYVIYLLLFCFFVSTDYYLFIQMLMYLMMLTVLVSYENVSIYEKNLFINVIFLSLLLLFLSTTENAYRCTFNFGERKGDTYESNQLTLGFNNPNETGIVLYYSIVLIISLICTINQKRCVKLVLFFIVAGLFVLLILTGSRSCLLALIFSVVFYYIYKSRMLHGSPIKKTTISLLFFSPIVFSFVYQFLALELSTDIMFLGKPLFSGREVIFQEAFSHYITSPLVGDIHYFRFANSFNGFLSILFNTGLIGLLFYVIIMYNSIVKLSKKIASKQQLFAFGSLLGTYLIACSESVVLVGGGNWFVFMLSLFILADKPLLNTNSNRELLRM